LCDYNEHYVYNSEDECLKKYEAMREEIHSSIAEVYRMLPRDLYFSDVLDQSVRLYITEHTI
jgi:hypothetical protein